MPSDAAADDEPCAYTLELVKRLPSIPTFHHVIRQHVRPRDREASHRLVLSGDWRWLTERHLCCYDSFVPTKVKEAIRIVEVDGWFQVKSRGSSHRQYKHATKPGRVTIAGKPSDDLSPKTFESILRQAGLKK